MKTESVMNKPYCQPQVTWYPVTAMAVLCSSGGENSGLGGNGEPPGGDPETQGRAPKF